MFVQLPIEPNQLPLNNKLKPVISQQYFLLIFMWYKKYTQFCQNKFEKKNVAVPSKHRQSGTADTDRTQN